MTATAPIHTAPDRLRGTLAGRFLAGLRRSPRGEALRVGERSWTYTELHELALTWAGALPARAGDTPRRVGVLAARSPEAYAGVLAALYAGATVVPLNPDFPVARTAATVTALPLDAVLADARGHPLLAELSGVLGDADVVLPDAALDAPGCVRPDRPLAAPVPVDPSEVAYVLFTSGSTGRPKGAPVTHANMDAFLVHNDLRYGFGPSDVFSQTFDLTFDLVMFDLFMAWGAGATLVSTPPQAFVSLPRFVARHGITVWFSVPSAIALARRRGLAAGAMPTLRWSLFCGERLLRADVEDWHRAAPHSAVENLYGPTELTIACSAYRWSPDDPDERFVDGVVPLGQPYPHVPVVVVDEHGRPGADEGELCARGPQTFPGYLDPADDGPRFLTCDGHRWYRTGDRVRATPGAAGFSHLGRTDQQVKIRGYRIETAEVEHALRGLDGVDEAAVVAFDDGGRRELAAFHTGRPLAAADVVSALGRTLPDFMLPRRVQHLEALPLNANRKVDRRALAGLAGGAR